MCLYVSVSVDVWTYTDMRLCIFHEAYDAARCGAVRCASLSLPLSLSLAPSFSLAFGCPHDVPRCNSRAYVLETHTKSFVDDANCPTEAYPFNPNGSPDGIAGLCSEDGRHLAVMPHPERCFLTWQVKCSNA